MPVVEAVHVISARRFALVEQVAAVPAAVRERAVVEPQILVAVVVQLAMQGHKRGHQDLAVRV